MFDSSSDHQLGTLPADKLIKLIANLGYQQKKQNAYNHCTLCCPHNNTLSLDEYDYTVSFYAPYIEIVFDNIVEFDNADEELISKVQSHKDFVDSLKLKFRKEKMALFSYF